MRRWVVLLGCFIGMAVTMSAMFTFPLGLYMKAITTEFGWSRTQFSATLSFVAVSNIIMLPLSGWAVDRLGAVRCILIGLTVGCLSYAALAFTKTYAEFIAVSCLASMSGCLALYPAYFKIVRGWFDKNLGLALAVASGGVPVGVALFSYLIKTTIDAGGWKKAVVVVAATALFVGLLNVFLLIKENRGSLIQAERLDNDFEIMPAGQSLRSALGTTDFWLFSIAFALIVFAGAGPNLHLPALIADRGGSPGTIASAVAAVAIGSLSGRVITGILLDRFSVRIVATGFFLVQALGILMLWRHAPQVIVAAFFVGTAQGAELDMMGFVMARRFGRQAYARIFASSFAISQIGLILSPVTMGAVFDATHSYDLALVCYPILCVAAILMIVRANTRPPGQQGASSGGSAALLATSNAAGK